MAGAALGGCKFFSADVVDGGSEGAAGNAVGSAAVPGKVGIFGAAAKAGMLELLGIDGSEGVAGIEGSFGIAGMLALGVSEVGSLLVIPAGGASVSDVMPLCAQAGAAMAIAHNTCPITTRRIACPPTTENLRLDHVTDSMHVLFGRALFAAANCRRRAAACCSRSAA